MCALIFTAQGDMRQAINNLQSTFYGFGKVDADTVFKVCDQPHPEIVRQIVMSCVEGQLDRALEFADHLRSKVYLLPFPFLSDPSHLPTLLFLYFFPLPLFLVASQGFSGLDIVGTLFYLVPRLPFAEEEMKFLLIREIGQTQLLLLDGGDEAVQLSGLIARMCLLAAKNGWVKIKRSDDPIPGRQKGAPATEAPEDEEPPAAAAAAPAGAPSVLQLMADQLEVRTEHERAKAGLAARPSDSAMELEEAQTPVDSDDDAAADAEPPAADQKKQKGLTLTADDEDEDDDVGGDA
jgi:hypothetical protein